MIIIKWSLSCDCSKSVIGFFMVCHDLVDSSWHRPWKLLCEFCLLIARHEQISMNAPCRMVCCGIVHLQYHSRQIYQLSAKWPWESATMGGVGWLKWSYILAGFCRSFTLFGWRYNLQWECSDITFSIENDRYVWCMVPFVNASAQ